MWSLCNRKIARIQKIRGNTISDFKVLNKAQSYISDLNLKLSFRLVLLWFLRSLWPFFRLYCRNNLSSVSEFRHRFDLWNFKVPHYGTFQDYGNAKWRYSILIAINSYAILFQLHFELHKLFKEVLKKFLKIFCSRSFRVFLFLLKQNGPQHFWPIW